MEQRRVRYILEETSQLHDKVDEVYEALMDNEHKQAIKLLVQLADKARLIKSDLIIKKN